MTTTAAAAPHRPCATPSHSNADPPTSAAHRHCFCSCGTFRGDTPSTGTFKYHTIIHPVPKADTCTSPRRLHECQYREQAENRRVAQFPTWTRVSHGRNQGRGGMRWKSRALHLSADRVSGAAAERTRPDCDQHGNGWQERGIPRGDVFGCSFKQNDMQNILPPQPTDGRTSSGPPGTWGQQPACLHAEASGSRQDRVSSPVRAEQEPLARRPDAAGCSMAAAACREETLGEGNTHPSGQPAH